MFFLSKIDDITAFFTPRSVQDLTMLIMSDFIFPAFILSFVWLLISLEPICSKTTAGWSSWSVGTISWFDFLVEAPRKTLKYVFLPLIDFWKISLFIPFRWLSPTTWIFYPNLVASNYVLLPSAISSFLSARNSS